MLIKGSHVTNMSACEIPRQSQIQRQVTNMPLWGGGYEAYFLRSVIFPKF